MCLIVFAWKSHPRYELILAANRDEHHAREAIALHRWRDVPDVVAGRDQEAGGTWLGIGRDGRFAAVTNYREDVAQAFSGASRGEIVVDFLSGTETASTFCEAFQDERYAGVNVLARSAGQLTYVSNRGDEPRELPPGVYGLGNASLDTPWPKLLRARTGLADLLSRDRIDDRSLLALMADRTRLPIVEKSVALPFHLAAALSAIFIVARDYGTRCTTVVMQDGSGTGSVTERRFDASGESLGTTRLGLVVENL